MTNYERMWSVGYAQSGVAKLRSSPSYYDLQPAGSYRVVGLNETAAKQEALMYFRTRFKIDLESQDISVTVVTKPV